VERLEIQPSPTMSDLQPSNDLPASLLLFSRRYSNLVRCPSSSGMSPVRTGNNGRKTRQRGAALFVNTYKYMLFGVAHNNGTDEIDETDEIGQYRHPVGHACHRKKKITTSSPPRGGGAQLMEPVDPPRTQHRIRSARKPLRSPVRPLLQR